MSLSPSVLIDTLLNADIKPNDLIMYFDVIILLIKKHWKKIYTSAMMKTIQKGDNNVYVLLQILVHYKKQTIADINYLSKCIKSQSKDYMPSFTVSIPKEKYQTSIEKNIKKNFPTSQIHTTSNIDLWVSISWEWRHYKRNLDQDIQKILW